MLKINRQKLDIFFKYFNLILIVSIIFLYLWVFLSISTHNNGDPNDYIRLARKISFLMPVPLEKSNALLRLPGYPYFIKIFSLNLHKFNLLFLSQAIIFLLSFFYFVKTFIKNKYLKFIIYIPALLPQIAYSQKLLFPDGLLLSLNLLFLILLKNKKFIYALLLALIISSIKIIFIFLVIIVFIAWKYETIRKIKFYLKTIFIILFIGLSLLFLYFKTTYLLFGTLAIRPVLNKYIFEQFIPNKEFNIECNNNDFKVNLFNQKEPMSDYNVGNIERYMPLDKNFVESNSCSKFDIEKIQKQSLIQIFIYRPWLQIKLLIKSFYSAFKGHYDNSILRNMYLTKLHYIQQHFDPKNFYEDVQIKDFNILNIRPIEIPNNYFGIILYSIVSILYQFIIRIIETIFIFMVILSIFRKSPKCKLKFERDTIMLFIFLIFYSFILALSAVLLSDRYTMISLFVYPIFLIYLISDIAKIINFKKFRIIEFS